MRILIPLFLIFSCSCLSAQTVYYVDHDATGLNDGSSWTNAFTDLQIAINTGIANSSVANPSELWVKLGNYFPTQDDSGNSNPSDPREKVFHNNGTYATNISIYGGFIGTETNLSQRNFVSNRTYLSGLFDLNYHILHLNFTDDSFILDGFTIEFGNATGTVNLQILGGGILARSTEAIFRNCEIKNNTAANGGGMWANGSSVTFEDCIFEGNTGSTTPTLASGHILYIAGTNPSGPNTFRRCTFRNNIHLVSGISSGIYEDRSNSLYEDCIFYGNDCVNCNGLFEINENGFTSPPNIILRNCLMYNDYKGTSNTTGYINHVKGTLSLDNCTAHGNGNTAGVFLNAASIASVNNSILWNLGTELATNAPALLSANNSIVKGSIPANVANTDNLENVDPLFNNTATNDFSLLPCSPAYNKGNNAFVNSTSDLAANTRNRFSTVDIGAYEIQTERNIVSSASAAILATREMTSPDGWTQYYDCANNLMLLEVKKNGENIGLVGDGSFQLQVATNNNHGGGIGVDLSTANYVNASDFYASNKSWTLSPTSQPNNEVGMRFYYNEEDFTDLQGSFGGINSIEDAVIFKVPGTNAFATNISSSNYREYLYSTDVASTTEFVTGSKDGLDYLEFNVSSFSSGSIGAGSGVDGGALPIELMSFNVHKTKEGKANIQYHLYADYHSEVSIESSTDGHHWSSIQQYIYKSGGEYKEQYIDPAPQQGTNYYRLRMYEIPTDDLDFSAIASLEFTGKSFFRLSSNTISTQQLTYVYQPTIQPNQDTPQLEGIIYNSIGQVIQHFTLTKSGQQTLELNENISLGHYWMGIYIDNNQLHQTRFVKI